METKQDKKEEIKAGIVRAKEEGNFGLAEQLEKELKEVTEDAR
jgi:hypothetical protein